MPASHHSLSLTPPRLSPAWRCFLLWQLALPSLSFCPKAPTPCFPSGGKSSSPICLAWTGSRPRLNRAPPSFHRVGYPLLCPSGRHRHRPKAHRGQHRQTGAKTHTVRQQRAKHHHCTGFEKPEPFRCHPDPAGCRFYRFRRLYPQRSHPAGRYRYSAISCRRHRTGSRGLYYPYRCPCRTRPVPPSAVPAGHVGRRSAPPPCHCGAAAHSDPLQSDRGTITAQDPLPGTLLHRNAHVRLVAK